MTDLAKIVIEATDNSKGALQSAAANLQGVKGAAGELQSKLEALGGFLGIAFTAAAIADVAKYRAELGRLSVVTGSAVENLSVIGQAAKLAGVDMGTVEAAMVKLTKGLSASNAETKDTARALAYLGVSGRDAAGNLRDPGVVMQEIAKAMGPLGDGSNKTAIALALFGKSGAQVLPILKEMYENGDLVAKVTTEQTHQAREYEKALTRLGVAQGAVGRMIYGELIVPATELVKAWTANINGANGLNAAVRDLSKNGDLTSWGEKATYAGAFAIDAFRGVMVMIQAVGTAIGGNLAMLDAYLTGVANGFSKLKSGDFSGVLDSLADARAKITGIQQETRDGIAAILMGYKTIRFDLEGRLKLQKEINSYEKDNWDRQGATPERPGFKGTDHEKRVKEASEYAKAMDDANQRVAAAYAETLAQVTALTGAEKKLVELRASDVWKNFKDQQGLTATQQRINLRVTLEEAAAFEKVSAAQKEWNKTMEEAAKYSAEFEKKQNDEIITTNAKASAINQEITNYGKLPSAIEQATLAQLKQTLALAEFNGASEDTLTQLRNMVLAQQNYATALKNKEGFQEMQNGMAKMTEIMSAVGDAIGNIAVSFAGGWKRGIETTRGYLKSLLADLTAMMAKRWFLDIVAGASVTGSMTANAASGSSLLGSALTGGGGSLLGSAANILGGAFGAGSIFGTAGAYGAALGTTSIAAGSQAALLAAQTGVFGASGLAATGAAAGGAAGGATAGLASIGPVGWIALAALAAYAIFAQKGGGAKVGGSFQGSFDSTGALTSSNPTSLFGLTAGESTGNGATQSLATATAKQYFDLVKKFGGTSQGVSFGLGYDSDPRGTADNRITGIVKDALGKTLFADMGRAIGRDNDKIGTELELTANRALLAALQASKLPADIAAIIDSVAASGASKAQIDDVLARASAMQQLFGAIGISLDTVISPIKTAIALIHDQGAALAEFAKNSDRSAKSLADLTVATAQYRANVTALIAQYEEAKTAIGKTIDDTIRGFVFGTLDTAGQYSMLQSEAQALRDSLGGMTDATMITSAIQQVAQLSSQAFGLLDPATQKAQLDEFIDGLKDAQTTASTRLTDLQQATADAANQANEEIRKNIATERDTAAMNRETALIERETAIINAGTLRQGLTINVGGAEVDSQYGS